LAIATAPRVRRAELTFTYDRLEAGKPMARHINHLLSDTRGIAALEYALIAGLIFAAIIAAGRLYGPALQNGLGNIGQSIVARDAGT
jgi:Flp pilus assembly pilin Flp